MSLPISECRRRKLIIGLLSVLSFSLRSTKAFASISLRHRYPIILYDSLDDAGEDKSPSKKKKPLSASEEEQRAESKRRKERENDVVIGKTSAVPGAADFAIDPKSTEEKWMSQASQIEKEVFLQTDRGLEKLKMLQLEEATQCFDRVFELKPTAYLWQAGIARYFCDDLSGASSVFARSIPQAETRFGMAATEERIWRDACELKYLHGLSRNERKRLKQDRSLLEEVIDPEPVMEHVKDDPFNPKERRKVFRIVQEMFNASVQNGLSSTKVILSRAKLRAICGTYDDTPKADTKQWKLTAWYYLGLHYEAIGDEEEAKKCLKAALRLCPSFGVGEDFIHTLPTLHMARRDWFDDDDFEPQAGTSKSTSCTSDNVLLDSIQSSVAQMNLVQIEDALKARGLKHYGMKEALKTKLVAALIEDLQLEIGKAGTP